MKAANTTYIMHIITYTSHTTFIILINQEFYTICYRAAFTYTIYVKLVKTLILTIFEMWCSILLVCNYDRKKLKTVEDANKIVADA